MAGDDSQQSARRRIRFAQARSIGIILVLVALLALVMFNALAEGTPWVDRDRDVRLLMTLLSILLGIDVLVGNHRTIARILGRLLTEYAENSHHPNQPPYPRGRDLDRDPARAQDSNDPPPADGPASDRPPDHTPTRDRPHDHDHDRERE